MTTTTIEKTLERLREVLQPALVEDLVEEIEDLIRDRDTWQGEARGAKDDLEKAQDKLEEQDGKAADLVRHLHDRFRHGGPVAFCHAPVCDEAISFLTLEGVTVR